MHFIKTLLWILKTNNYHEKFHQFLEYPKKVRKIFYTLLTSSIILIVLGVVFLLDSLDIISIGPFSAIWPAILILIGLYLFIKVRHFYGFIAKISKTVESVEKKILHPFDD